MAAKASIIKIYINADPAKKVDIICKHYPNFIGIVDSYTEGLRYMIENEKSYNQKASIGDLGIRVQSIGHYTDTTGDTAVNNVTVRDALIRCDFSEGILNGIDSSEEIQRKAFILKDMRKDYELFNNQLQILSENEYKLFQNYLRREKTIMDIAETEGIQYDSALQKLRRLKKKIKIQMIGFLDGNM